MYLDKLEHSVASYRGRTKVKFSRDTLTSNLINMRNTQDIHDANHFKWFVTGSVIIVYIKIIKHTFSMIIFFREMYHSRSYGGGGGCNGRLHAGLPGDA